MVVSVVVSCNLYGRHASFGLRMGALCSGAVSAVPARSGVLGCNRLQIYGFLICPTNYPTAFFDFFSVILCGKGSSGWEYIMPLAAGPLADNRKSADGCPIIRSPIFGYSPAAILSTAYGGGLSGTCRPCPPASGHKKAAAGNLVPSAAPCGQSRCLLKQCERPERETAVFNRGVYYQFIAGVLRA